MRIRKYRCTKRGAQLFGDGRGAQVAVAVPLKCLTLGAGQFLDHPADPQGRSVRRRRMGLLRSAMLGRVDDVLAWLETDPAAYDVVAAAILCADADAAYEVRLMRRRLGAASPGDRASRARALRRR